MSAPREVELHAAYGRQFFGGAECRCPICKGDRERKTLFTEEELRRALIEATFQLQSDHSVCGHPRYCQYVELDRIISDIKTRRVSVTPICPSCHGTKKILEDHDGRAGYRPCEECA